MFSRVIYIIIFLVGVIGLQSFQSINQWEDVEYYFDQEWKEVSIIQAKYYRKTTKINDTTFSYVEYLLITNEMLESGEILYSGGEKGVKHGWSKSFRLGHMYKEGNYSFGKQAGIWIGWGEDGSKEWETDYVKGKREGISRSWFSSGELASESNYSRDTLCGQYKAYFVDGKPAIVGDNNCGEREGVWKAFYPSGVLRFQGEFKKGLIDGMVTEYFEDGRISGCANFKAGEPDGTIYLMNDIGDTVCIKEYDPLKGLLEEYYFSDKQKIKIKEEDISFVSPVANVDLSKYLNDLCELPGFKPKEVNRVYGIEVDRMGKVTSVSSKEFITGKMSESEKMLKSRLEDIPTYRPATYNGRTNEAYADVFISGNSGNLVITEKWILPLKEFSLGTGPNSNTEFSYSEKMPMIGNCETQACFQKEFMNYLTKNVRYPVSAETNGISGKVYLTFIIERSGMIKRVNISKSSGYYALDNEALRVIKSLPDFIPGEICGQKVSVYYNVPVIFRLN